jgi:hypothetical protein
MTNLGDHRNMLDDHEKKERILEFCRGLFNTSNLIATDFDDVSIFAVTGRDFIQQPGGTGLHVTFSVSWHAIGKTGKDAHDALSVLLPSEEEE